MSWFERIKKGVHDIENKFKNIVHKSPSQKKSNKNNVPTGYSGIIKTPTGIIISKPEVDKSGNVKQNIEIIQKKYTARDIIQGGGGGGGSPTTSATPTQSTPQTTKAKQQTQKQVKSGVSLQNEIQRYESLGYKPSEAKILAQESVKRGGFTFSPSYAKQILSKQKASQGQRTGYVVQPYAETPVQQPKLTWGQAIKQTLFRAMHPREFWGEITTPLRWAKGGSLASLGVSVASSSLVLPSLMTFAKRSQITLPSNAPLSEKLYQSSPLIEASVGTPSRASSMFFKASKEALSSELFRGAYQNYVKNKKEMVVLGVRKKAGLSFVKVGVKAEHLKKNLVKGTMKLSGEIETLFGKKKIKGSSEILGKVSGAKILNKRAGIGDYLVYEGSKVKRVYSWGIEKTKNVAGKPIKTIWGGQIKKFVQGSRKVADVVTPTHRFKLYKTRTLGLGKYEVKAFRLSDVLGNFARPIIAKKGGSSSSLVKGTGKSVGRQITGQVSKTELSSLVSLPSVAEKSALNTRSISRVITKHVAPLTAALLPKAKGRARTKSVAVVKPKIKSRSETKFGLRSLSRVVPALSSSSLQKAKTRQKSASLLKLRLTQKPVTPSPISPLPKLTLSKLSLPPVMPRLPISFKGFAKSFKSLGVREAFQYTPSLSAILHNIKGRTKGIFVGGRELFTGLEVRGIPTRKSKKRRSGKRKSRK